MGVEGHTKSIRLNLNRCYKVLHFTKSHNMLASILVLQITTKVQRARKHTKIFYLFRTHNSSRFGRLLLKSVN